MNFLKNYNKWEDLSLEQKKSVVEDCVKFYENKTLDYILSNLPKAKRDKFKKEPVKVEYTKSSSNKPVGFGDNVVFVASPFLLKKSDLFFKIAQNTICSVFANLFKNTSGDKKKKTKFGELATGFLASITSEFAKGAEFENDMMQEFASVLDLDLGLSKE